jgi:hypothetical protein
MITERLTKNIAPLHMCATDTITVDFTDKAGQTHKLLNLRPIQKNVVVDKIVVVHVENEHGLKDGFGILLGKAAE